MEQLIARACGDLNGDGRAETALLLGKSAPDSPLWHDVRLVVRPGAGGGETRLALPWDAGYGPRLSLWRLTSREREDILVSLDSGGSGGTGLYAVYRWDGGGYALAFDSQAYEAETAYRVRYVDQYAVRAENLHSGMAYLIDLAARDAAYLDEIYDENGFLRAPHEGSVDPISLLYPADADGDGLLELVAWQRVSGLYHADALGDFISVLAWDGERFSLRSQTLGIFGARI